MRLSDMRESPSSPAKPAEVPSADRAALEHDLAVAHRELLRATSALLSSHPPGPERLLRARDRVREAVRRLERMRALDERLNGGRREG